MTKVLLYSGGMDSWLIDKLWKPDVKLYISIGTECSEHEIKRLPKDVIVKQFDLSQYELKDKNYILPLRNLFFVMLASYYGDEICLGSTADDKHFDNGPDFIERAENTINYLWSELGTKSIKVVMPYAHLTKAQLLQKYIDNGGDIKTAWEETFSCYTPINGKECGKCSSCIQKRNAFKQCGFKLYSNYLYLDTMIRGGWV